MSCLSIIAAGMICGSPIAVDGDTLRFGRQYVRLWGVDAEELDEPNGPRARAILKDVVDGLGPSLDLLADRLPDGSIRSTGLVEKAREVGLKVHPYTVRTEMQPKWSNSLEQTHHFLIEELKVDGFFTDFPDLGRAAVAQPQRAMP